MKLERCSEFYLIISNVKRATGYRSASIFLTSPYLTLHEYVNTTGSLPCGVFFFQISAQNVYRATVIHMGRIAAPPGEYHGQTTASLWRPKSRTSIKGSEIFHSHPIQHFPSVDHWRKGTLSASAPLGCYVLLLNDLVI